MISTQATPMNYIDGKGHKSELKSNGSYLINHTKSKSCHQLYMASEAYAHTSRQGRIQDSKKGGAQLCYCEHGNCVRSTQSGMQSMPNLGGSGGMPPQKILKN